MAQILRNNDLEFYVAKKNLDDDFGNLISIQTALPAEIGSETEIKKYILKLEKESSNLLSFLLKMEYRLDLINPLEDNILNFKIKSIVFIDNKNLLILKTFLICLFISYSIIFLFVNRKKIRFI